MFLLSYSIPGGKDLGGTGGIMTPPVEGGMYETCSLFSPSRLQMLGAFGNTGRVGAGRGGHVRDR